LELKNVFALAKMAANPNQLDDIAALELWLVQMFKAQCRVNEACIDIGPKGKDVGVLELARRLKDLSYLVRDAVDKAVAIGATTSLASFRRVDDEWDEGAEYDSDDDVPGTPAPYMVQLTPASFEALKAALQKAIPKLVA
jgi:hypothetical protein